MKRHERRAVRGHGRFTISISGAVAERLDAWCDRTGVSASSVVETETHRHLDRIGWPMPSAGTS